MTEESQATNLRLVEPSSPHTWARSLPFPDNNSGADQDLSDKTIARGVANPPQSPPLSERKRDQVWDTCAEVLGYEPATSSEKALWGKMVHSLRGAGADHEKLIAVAEWYHRKWPDLDLTITAIEKWYSHFLAMAEKRNGAKRRSVASTCPDCEMGGNLHTADCPRVGKV